MAAQTQAGKGKAFFDRADEVAGTGNWDFAIELYLEGLQREPDNIDRGHKKLREVSLNRKAQGGKGPGMMDGLKRRPGKDPLKNLINAHYLLSREPGSVPYLEQVLKACQALEIDEVAKWLCGILLETQRQVDKPSKRVLTVLTRAYEALNDYALAAEACRRALEVVPNDVELAEEYKRLSTQDTIQRGKYDQEGDFSKGVKDMDKQVELAQSDMMAQSKNVLQQQLARARKEYDESPTVPGKINALADALLKFADEAYENEAVDVLLKAHRDTSAYQFKMRVGDIKMRQNKRLATRLSKAGDKAALREHLQKILAMELDEFAERAANYPTDLSLKFELGRRLLAVGKHDDAIAALQQAQRDPRRHVQAMSALGQAFARKGWFSEACDTCRRTLEAEMPEERAKEIRYNFGDCLEKMADRQEGDEQKGTWREALEQFSEVAQIEFSYKDVRDRVEQLRSKLGR